jgi:hypothetical protein
MNDRVRNSSPVPHREAELELGDDNHDHLIAPEEKMRVAASIQ